MFGLKEIRNNIRDLWTVVDNNSAQLSELNRKVRELEETLSVNADTIINVNDKEEITFEVTFKPKEFLTLQSRPKLINTISESILDAIEEYEENAE